MCMYLNSREMPEGTFGSEEPCRVLLSMRHVRALGIDLNAHAKRLKHVEVQYLSQTHPDSVAVYARTCKVTEKVVSQFLDSRGGTAKEPKRCSVEDVHVGDSLSVLTSGVLGIMAEYWFVGAGHSWPIIKGSQPMAHSSLATCEKTS